MSWFDESRLDDERALQGIDPLLRSLAESGARVRREAAGAEAVGAETGVSRPRAVLAAGPDSRLLRAVLEPWCPVPFVAWPSAGLPGWVGSLDLVVVLAPGGSDRSAASAVAEAARRGASVVVACPARSLVAEHAGRDTVLLPTETGDQLAAAVVTLAHLSRLGLGPATGAEEVAQALDEVAIGCSPHRDLSTNPAKMLAISLADATPVLWGGSVLAARAARRVAESLRQTTGRSALAGDAVQLLPMLEATRPRDVFDDPFATDASPERRPVLVLLDDGADDPMTREDRGRLRAAANERGIRVEELTAATGSEVARYAGLVLSGRYASAYLGLGLLDD